MANTHDIITDMETTAAQFGVKPSTLGEKMGQGGQFYARLTKGARVWPETADWVSTALKFMRDNGNIDLPKGLRDQSHGNATNHLQAAGSKDRSSVSKVAS